MSSKTKQTDEGDVGGGCEAGKEAAGSVQGVGSQGGQAGGRVIEIP